MNKIKSVDTVEVKRRLVITLGRLYPGRDTFTMPEVMEALEIMGE